MGIVTFLRLSLSQILDKIQRSLSTDPKYSHWSRSQLIDRLEKLENQVRSFTPIAEERERTDEDLSRQIIRLFDDVEGIARGNLCIRAEVEANCTGAIADSLNFFLDELCEYLAELPSDSPLRQKYHIPQDNDP